MASLMHNFFTLVWSHFSKNRYFFSRCCSRVRSPEPSASAYLLALCEWSFLIPTLITSTTGQLPFFPLCSLSWFSSTPVFCNWVHLKCVVMWVLCHFLPSFSFLSLPCTVFYWSCTFSHVLGLRCRYNAFVRVIGVPFSTTRAR